MFSQTEKFIKKYSIKNKKIIIAFSGGPDSVYLTYAINKLKDKYNLKPILCYFNHGWREEAKEEEKFTSELASKLQFEYQIGKMPKNVKQSEEKAREYRYAFLNKCADKFSTDVVVLAHNKNDNVETLIYRVIKGTSISGLTSIPEKRDIYYRPLLNTTKETILSYLNKENIPYKTDSSNEDIKYKRNLIRKEIFPLFSKINPKFIESISNLIENAHSSRKIIDECIKSTEDEIFKNNKIIQSKFIKLSKEKRYEILNKFLFNYLKTRDFKTIKKIDDFILQNKKSKISINSEYFLIIKDDLIFLNTPSKNTTSKKVLTIEKTGLYEFENLKIEVTKEIYPSKFPKTKAYECFLNIDFPIQVRHRKAGDIFSPLGLVGKMKLKEYLINEKIPVETRDDIILVAKDNEVCWIAGYKISENFKSKQNTKCYKIKIIKE